VTAASHRPLDSGSGVIGATHHLLHALPVAETERLARTLSPIFLDTRAVLLEPDLAVEAVYFPRTCVVSLVAPLHDGSGVEVAMVGAEGIVGVPLVLGRSLAVRAVCSVEGWADRMEATAFADEVERGGAVSVLVNDYLQALFGQIAVVAACNRLHSTDQRVSRWLLMAHDRLRADRFMLTHRLLSRVLGVRRATVTRSMGILQSAGAIAYSRGRVTIVDRTILEGAACECYEMVERELDGVVQRAAGELDEVEISGAGAGERRRQAHPSVAVRPWRHGGAAEAME
jgi:CRP-like cAMP-binding protein